MARTNDYRRSNLDLQGREAEAYRTQEEGGMLPPTNIVLLEQEVWNQISAASRT